MDFVERDAELAALSSILSNAATGTGSAVAIAGEPGAGKSTLVDAACARAKRLRILRGGCDPLVTPRPLGPIRDLLSAIGSPTPDATLAELCELAYDALRSEPTAVVIEDAHWIDAASVEVLRFLVRRLESMPCALVITYRDDEIGVQHSARPLLGDFAAIERLSSLRLNPLSVEAVGVLVGGTPLAAEAVHAVTGGNPFFVAEVAKEPDLPLPSTVRDAVLARTANIAADDFEVLQLAAAAPDQLDDRVLPALGVDLPTLWRLQETGLLLRSHRGLVFRHELARLALESTIPPGGDARLHSRLLDALEQIEPRDSAVLTHHAVAASDARRATKYAIEAAQESVRSASHSEAAAFFQIAIDNFTGDDPAERAQLLMQLANEQYMISNLDEAIASITESFPLWREAGNLVGLAAAHELRAILEYYSARRVEAEQHVEVAASLAEDSSPLHFGSARVTHGYFAYQKTDFDFSIACTSDGAKAAEQTDSDQLRLRTGLIRSLRQLALDGFTARSLVHDVIEEAREHRLDELASTGYSGLSYLDVEQRRLAAAERLLEESLAFTIERDIPICNHWQTAVRSRLRFLEGRWSAALEDAEDVVRRDGMPLATVWPHVVSGLVPLRQGGSDGEHLDTAWNLAVQLDEPMRRVPVLAALAEKVWLTGEPDVRVEENAIADLTRATQSPATIWSVGELAVWLWRLGLSADVPLDAVAEPYRLTLTGQHREAAAWWKQAGVIFEQAMSNADSDNLADRLQSIEQFDLLGATAVGDRMRRQLRQDGVAQVPQRPRASTRANPSGLTNRQLDVAKLVARGFTNAEIASRLFISTKTADHHVSAVLEKLGVSNRRAVVVRASEMGLS